MILCVAALAGLGAAPAAQAKFTLGIGEQTTSMLDDPRFQALGVRYMRVVVPYDVMSKPVQLGRYAPVLEQARDRGMRVLVAFNHSAETPRRLPSVTQYQRAVKSFRATFPWVTDYSVWNEANHSSQPLHRDPRQAARFYNAIRSLCSGCKVVAADVLDQRGFETWIKTFRRYAKSPKYWGLHNYTDVNRLRDQSITRMRRATGNRGSVWLTETGGIVRFARSWAYDEKRAAKATSHVLKIAAKRRVQRVYLYRWLGEPLGSRWDSGLVASDGRARPALNVVEAHLRKPRTLLPRAPRIAKFPTAPRLG